MLQSKAVLVQRRLRAIPTCDGQCTAEVCNARAAVCHSDLHGITKIFQRQHYPHGQLGIAAVGAEVGDRVVHQLTDDLCHAVEIVPDTGEQAVAGRIIADDFLRDGRLVFDFHRCNSSCYRLS